MGGGCAGKRSPAWLEFHANHSSRVIMNELANFRDAFRGITPYFGTPPKGFLVDFLGTLTDSRFRVDFNGNPETDGGSPVTTRLPIIEDGEGWFEAVNWVEAARAARDRYVMITLGACYAGQAV